MKKNTFTPSIYACTQTSDDMLNESPYQTWFRLTTEKVLLQFWLQEHLSTFALSKVTNRPIRVLDLGCDFGHMSQRLIRILLSMNLQIDYTGVDPYQTQLDQFQQSTQSTPNLSLRLLKGNASTHAPDQQYDLIFASHMLYYVQDWNDTLTSIINAGREIILVHHDPRGINTIQERFREHVHQEPHIISTDDQVANTLPLLPFNGKRITHYRFPSTVMIRSCQLPGSRAGNNLISFFLERPFQEIPSCTLKEVRAFMRDLWAPDHLMVHDVGVITIR